MTLNELKAMVAKAGFKIGHAYCHENDQFIYACSVETYGAKTYGHAKYEVQFNKETGLLQWSSPSGHGSDRLAVVI